MTYLKIINATVAVTCLAVFSSSIPTASQAKQSYDLCKFDEVPASFIKKVKRRPDFESILQQMVESCPSAALALTEAATASTRTNATANTGGLDGGSNAIGGSAGTGGNGTGGGADTGGSAGTDGGTGTGGGNGNSGGAGTGGGNGNSGANNGNSGSSNGQGTSDSAGNQGKT